MFLKSVNGKLNSCTCGWAARVLVFFVVCAPAIGCGSDKPEPSPKVEQAAPLDQGKVDTRPVDVLSKPRRVKSEVNEMMDQEAADRARKMDEIFK